ncbi:MAG: YicC family protein [Deltaproteobacteria bacterium]|nr:YicC family protein [Deltaproteobacteria bacterium]MBW2047419.1 YicC family protein [Deltaproteobacteria bacterium]MBW2110413.1 YicC family protein [Deltaproteobacteria bacterium]MBW2355079.1 YicC family protein [Deltaproteobacteria bacterium]
MIKSMTAFGRGECRHKGVSYVAEIRSLNNRHRDIILRMLRNHQSLEEGLRSIVSSRIRRGRVEVSFQIEGGRETSSHEVELNVPLLESYLKAFRELAGRTGIDQEVRLESLLQLKDLILIKPETCDVEELEEGLQKALIAGLDALDRMRMREGAAIEEDFVKRLDRLERYVDKVHGRVPELAEAYRERLTRKVGSMIQDMEVDQSRLAQEVAFLVERSDITEEIVRIRSHLGQFRDYLLTGDAVGRRLDFLIQEISREVNTLGVKGSDTTISRTVVEMKAELEKLREQVQNVE